MHMFKNLLLAGTAAALLAVQPVHAQTANDAARIDRIERAYLDALAARLNLPAEVRASLDREALA